MYKCKIQSKLLPRLCFTSATDLCLESSLDCIDRPTGLARVACYEVDTIVLAKRSIRSFASFASHIFVCNIISSQEHGTPKIYVLMYFRKTFSICRCWKRPLSVRREPFSPPVEPVVPISANMYVMTCSIGRWILLLMSAMLANTVFLLPSL